MERVSALKRVSALERVSAYERAVMRLAGGNADVTLLREFEVVLTYDDVERVARLEFAARELCRQLRATKGQVFSWSVLFLKEKEPGVVASGEIFISPAQAQVRLAAYRTAAAAAREDLARTRVACATPAASGSTQTAILYGGTSSGEIQTAWSFDVRGNR